MILYIDTTDFNQMIFAVSIGGKINPGTFAKGALEGARIKKRNYKIDSHRSHETLGKLEQFLKTAKVKMKDIKKIVVNKGPGSYTGTRVGVTHALALGFALNVPVKPVAKEKFKIV